MLSRFHWNHLPEWRAMRFGGSPQHRIARSVGRATSPYRTQSEPQVSRTIVRQMVYFSAVTSSRSFIVRWNAAAFFRILSLLTVTRSSLGITVRFTVGRAAILILLSALSVSATAQSGEWAWMSGASTSLGHRNGHLWLFGGEGFDSIGSLWPLNQISDSFTRGVHRDLRTDRYSCPHSKYGRLIRFTLR